MSEAVEPLGGSDSTAPPSDPAPRVRSDVPFFAGLGLLAGFYVFVILALVAANAQYIEWKDITKVLDDPDIRASIRLSFFTCTISALLSVFVAVPAAYLLTRLEPPADPALGFFFRSGKRVVDAILDIPIVLPPLVVGLSLLILFHQVDVFGRSIENWFSAAFAWLKLIDPNLRPGITFKVPAVIIAQFTVACAFAVRSVQTAFDQVDRRCEDVALTLGSTRAGAFWDVLLPQAWRGVLTGGTVAWARALGEFGPILVFAGATRGRTEVLSTSVFLEINIGNLKGAVAISLLMIALSVAVIIAVRLLGAPGEQR